MEFSPSRGEVERLLRDFNIVPVWHEFTADGITPVSAFLRISDQGEAFLFESVTGPEKIGRFSFLGSAPGFVLKCHDSSVELILPDGRKRYEASDPLDEVDRIVRGFNSARFRELPGMTGGLVGYLSYDVVRFIEYLPNAPPDTLGCPDIYLMCFDTVVIFDHLKKTVRIVSNVMRDKSSYGEACGNIERVHKLLNHPIAPPVQPLRLPPKIHKRASSNFRREQFISAVKKCKEYIRAGDIFQVVLSQRFETETRASAFDVYRALRIINPSPYMFLLKLEGFELAGSSPEVMVKVEDGVIIERPIAGTRPRGSTSDEDLELEKELLADPKELAEHAMLVDLSRNDIGRVAEYGSVVVDERMTVERYSHVMHIVSNVRGKLVAGKSAVDVLRACLPAGTVSGAPKVRAMEILDELEPDRRGPYAGSVGLIDFNGNMNTCITIRTILFRNGKAYVQAGAGIVADSVPEREYDETANKAAALISAIQIAEEELS